MNGRRIAKVSALWIAATAVMGLVLEWAGAWHLGELGSGVLALGWLMHLVTERFPPSRKDLTTVAMGLLVNAWILLQFLMMVAMGVLFCLVGYWLILGVLRLVKALV